MSLNGALWLSSTAMNAQAQALGAISDNIANLNTGGYRKRTVAFSELLGSDDKFQAKSSGTKMSATTRVEAGGAYTTSARGLSAAFSGRALFPVAKDAAGSDTYYTRFGAFELTPDSAGVMRVATANDYYLMGWPVDASGAVTKSLETITVPNRTEPLPATATTTAAIADNLSASAAVGDEYRRSASVYDGSGALHTVELSFVNTGANAWNVTAASASGTVALATTPMPLTFDGSTGAAAGTTDVALGGTWANGETAAIGFSFGAMTQWGEESVPRPLETDGSPSGLVSAYYFDGDGFLNLAYSNGALRQLYQIPGAVFANANGLTEHSGDVFKQSRDSGDAMLIDPRASSLGNFLSGTLELSNVDLATEMTNLIQTQRAYSTAATAFRTIDEMITTMRDIT